LNGKLPFEALRDNLPLIFALEICFKETLPLYPPPLVREGEDIKKRGFAPLKHPLYRKQVII